MLNVRFGVRSSVGVCHVCLHSLVWPGTSLGSPASVMTEDQWLGLTSCGNLVQRCVIGSADRLEPPAACWVFFPCVQASDWVGRMPFSESQGQVTGTLSPSDSRSTGETLKPHRCPLLCVLGQRGATGTACSF